MVSCSEEQSITLSLPQINQGRDWCAPDWATLKWENWVADSSTKAQNLSAQNVSASVGDNLQLEKKQLLLTEGWGKMRLSNRDKENWWKFLASSACPCKEWYQWEAGSARSLAQGGRVGQSLGVPQLWQVGWCLLWAHARLAIVTCHHLCPRAAPCAPGAQQGWPRHCWAPSMALPTTRVCLLSLHLSPSSNSGIYILST